MSRSKFFYQILKIINKQQRKSLKKINFIWGHALAENKIGRKKKLKILEIKQSLQETQSIRVLTNVNIARIKFSI